MITFVKNIFDFLNPDSLSNIEKSIKNFKKIVEENNLITSEIKTLELAIEKTEDLNTKFSLKKELRNKLKVIKEDLEYQSLEDSVDKAW